MSTIFIWTFFVISVIIENSVQQTTDFSMYENWAFFHEELSGSGDFRKTDVVNELDTQLNIVIAYTFAPNYKQI